MKTRLARFCTGVQKTILNPKNAYFARVEALNIVEKDNETVRQSALKVQ